MTIYSGKDIPLLASAIRDKAAVATRAAALTLNKTATFSRNESVDDITSEVNLTPAYIKKHLKVTKRAKPTDLLAVISGTQRGTLLQRYPYTITKDQARVKVNKTGGAATIDGARMVVLKGSGEKVLGMFNKDFAELLDKVSGKSPAMSRKAARVKRAAVKKPYGRWPLHSRSINQLFTSVRENIQPRLRKFMRQTFIADFVRLSK